MGATLAEARTIVALDTNDQKLELARLAGVTHATSDADEVGDLTDGRAAHVIEAIGLTSTVEMAIDLVRPGGTVTLVGMTPQEERATVRLGSRGSRRSSVAPPARRVLQGPMPRVGIGILSP